MNLINVDKNGNDLPVKVFKDEKGKYTIGVSKKVGEEYQNRYFPVEFLKGVELENKTDIVIKHAFMTWFDWEFEDKKGTKFVIKITAFDKVGEQQKEITPQNIDKIGSPKELEIDDDELPFY
jgi:hypothetical protein